MPWPDVGEGPMSARKCVALVWRSSSGDVNLVEAVPPVVRVISAAAWWQEWQESATAIFAGRLREVVAPLNSNGEVVRLCLAEVPHLTLRRLSMKRVLINLIDNALVHGGSDSNHSTPVHFTAAPPPSPALPPVPAPGTPPCCPRCACAWSSSSPPSPPHAAAGGPACRCNIDFRRV